MAAPPSKAGDVVVVTQKIVSKAEGQLVNLEDVSPSPFAVQLSAESGRDPRLVELVLRESRSIVRVDPARGILITETKHGLVCANAGIDSSNVPGDGTSSACSPWTRTARPGRSGPRSPRWREWTSAVIVSDTFGRPWREGHVDFAIGVDGMDPFVDYRGTEDAQGNVLHVTRIAVADELSAAAEVVMGKALGIPAAIVRGVSYRPGEGGSSELPPRSVGRPVPVEQAHARYCARCERSDVDHLFPTPFAECGGGRFREICLILPHSVSFLSER